MRFQFQRFAGGILLAGLVAGCATTQPPTPPTTVPQAAISGPAPPSAWPPPAAAPPALAEAYSAAPARSGGQAGPRFADLEGWAEEDHAAALQAFRETCAVSRDPALAVVCARARILGSLDEPRARAFFEENFRLTPAAAGGLLTGYFSPVYAARSASQGEFTAPVRPPPAEIDSPPAAPEDRARIDGAPCFDALAWMRPEDLFFLQIQGSGVLVFPDGRRTRAVFGGTNGAPFVGIAGPMRQAGLLADEDTSAEAIHAWLAENRGPRAEAIMRLDPRYVFFHLAPDDGAEPTGAAGTPLIAGRSLAVDPSLHAFGELFWIDASAPFLSGAPPAYRRLAVALDSGGAIRGEARADLYLGRGLEAGREAGSVRHALTLYRLAPVEAPGS